MQTSNVHYRIWLAGLATAALVIVAGAILGPVDMASSRATGTAQVLDVSLMVPPAAGAPPVETAPEAR